MTVLHGGYCSSRELYLWCCSILCVGKSLISAMDASASVTLHIQ
jgi:hypothetical protein